MSSLAGGVSRALVSASVDAGDWERNDGARDGAFWKGERLGLRVGRSALPVEGHAMPLIVHFKRPSDWRETINIHYWDTSPAAASTTWPGAAMTAEGNGWFVFQFRDVEAAASWSTTGPGGRPATCGGTERAGFTPTTPGTTKTRSGRRFR